MGEIDRFSTKFAKPGDSGGLALLVVLGCALLLRTLWALVVPMVPLSDPAAYHELATSLAAGRGFAWQDGTLTAFWPPGTSFIYGVLLRGFGDSLATAVVLNVIAGVLVVYLGYRAARAIYGEMVGLLTAVSLAVWPILIQFTTIMASEILFLVPVLAAMVLVGEVKQPRWFHFVTFGLLISVASYIRPTATPLIILIPVLFSLRSFKIYALSGWIVVGGLICAVSLWPWMDRNTELFGQPTGISTNFGANLWMGNNPESQGVYQTFDEYMHIKNEKIRDDAMKADSLRFIVSHPESFVVLMGKRLRNTFDRETIGVVWNAVGIEQRFDNPEVVSKLLKLLSSAYWYLMVIIGLVGVFLMIRSEGWMILGNPMLLICLFFAAIPAIIVGQDRYHMPMIPMIACFAAYAVANFLEWRRGNLSPLSGAKVKR